MVCVNTEATLVDELFCYLASNPNAVVLTVSALLAYYSYKMARRSARYQNTIAEKAKYETDEALKKIYSVIGLINNKSEKDITALAVSGTETDESMAISYVLNRWEDIAIGIKYSIYDDEILFDSYAATAIIIWKGLKPFIQQRQLINPMAYNQFEILASRWALKKELRDKKNKELLNSVKEKM